MVTSGSVKAVQGNMDPAQLYAPAEEIKTAAAAMVRELGPRGLVANLGHGMYPDMCPEAVAAFVEGVHSVEVASE